MAKAVFIILGTGLVALLVAIGVSGSSQATDSTLSGTIEIDGSSTSFPISEAAAEEFRRLHPNVRINVGVSGTGGGFSRFVQGETDISNASRPIRDNEAEEASANGITFHELRIAIDGITVAVNPRNDFVDCLTVEELRRIWEPGSAIKRWDQVRPGFPDRPLRLYGPGTDSGTFDYFTEAIIGEARASRADYTASEDDNVLVQGILGDRNALGYFGYAFYVENRGRVKALGVDAGNGCVEPTEESIVAGRYVPLSRPLFIYVNDASLSRPQVGEFLRFFMENGRDLAASVGYVPESEETYRANLEALGLLAPPGASTPGQSSSDGGGD